MECLTAPAHTFDTIVGQDLVKRFLIRATEQERLSRALLFTGPVGVGKRSLMYAQAKRLVTHGMDPKSEQAQRAIGKIERGTHPDVLIVEPKSASGQILKIQVDEMHERAHYAPLESPHKVILIAPVEAMNVTSANNLLKLLEEPPPSLFMLLSTQQLHRTLSTIRSRCALLRCPPVEQAAMVEWLCQVGRCSERRARTAAALSGGRPGLALELLSGKDEERRRRVSGELEFFKREGYPSIFRVGRKLIEATGSAPEAITILLPWFRDMLVTTLRAEGDDPEIIARQVEDILINRDLAEEVAEAAMHHTPHALARAIDVLLKHFKNASRPFLDQDLLMEVLLTDLGIALK